MRLGTLNKFFYERMRFLTEKNGFKIRRLVDFISEE